MDLDLVEGSNVLDRWICFENDSYFDWQATQKVLEHSMQDSFGKFWATLSTITAWTTFKTHFYSFDLQLLYFLGAVYTFSL